MLKISQKFKADAHRLVQNQDGGIAVMSTFFLSVAIGLAALSVDTINVFMEKRQLQSVTDLAAIMAAKNPDKAGDIALKVFKQNGYPKARVVVTNLVEKTSENGEFQLPNTASEVLVKLTTGAYHPDLSLAPGDRFASRTEDIGAILVDAKAPAHLYFGSHLITPPLLNTIGVAAVSNEASIAIGTRLAALDGGLANTVLGSLFGTSVSLTVADYNSLAGANISVLPFLDALAINSNSQVATYNQLLDGSIDFGTFMEALAGTAVVGTSLENKLVALSKDSSIKKERVQLGKIFGLGTLGNLAIGSGNAAFESRLSAMNVLNAGLAVANEEHQIEFNLTNNLPGVAEIGARLAIGERMQTAPYFAVGPEGTIVRSAQIRLMLNIKLLGTGSLANVGINLPLYVESAYGEAKIDDIDCHSARPLKGDVTTAVKPGLAMLAVAAMDDLAFGDFDSRYPIHKATLVNSPLIKIKAAAKVESTNVNVSNLEFDQADIVKGTVKSVQTRDFLTTALDSLIGDLDVDATVGGLSLATPRLATNALIVQLAGVTETIDHALASTLDLLGVRLGEADVVLTGLDCGNSVLVQ